MTSRPSAPLFFQLIFACALSILMFVTRDARAADLNQGGGTFPYDVADIYWLGSFVKNDDGGVTYDRLELHHLWPLAQALYSLPQNQRRYPSVADLTADWQIAVTHDGTIFLGWYVRPAELNLITVLHRQEAYSDWRYPGGLGVDVNIPISQFDGNGDGWDLGPDDYVITRTDLLPAAAVAYDASGNSYPAEGYAYSVRLIPEPASLSLLLLAPALLLRRRTDDHRP